MSRIAFLDGYFDTERDFGLILEAIQIPKRRSEPDFALVSRASMYIVNPRALDRWTPAP